MKTKAPPSSSNEAGPRQPFKRIRTTKVPSKFERYGDEIIAYLKHTKQTGDTRIHWYQRDAVLKTQGLLLEDSGKRFQQDVLNTEVKPVLIVAPTGSGKSGMIALLPYVLKSRKVLVLTPSKVISSQLGIAFGEQRGEPSFFELTGITDEVLDDESEAKDLLEMPKIISSPSDITQFRDIVNNVVIVNAQKFGGNCGTSLIYNREEIIENVREFFDMFDTLLVDEAHHYPAKTWKNIVDNFSRPVAGMEKKIIFLTATPYRHCQKKGKKIFILGTGAEAKQRVAFEITPQTLEGNEIRVSTFIEKSDVTKVAQDIHQTLLKQQRQEPRFQPQALVIVRTKDEARKHVASFNKSLKNEKFAVAIIGEKQSEELTKAFTRGEFRVAVVCNLLKEGYDNPKVTMCVILRKIRSRILFSQFVGRCIRINRDLKKAKGGSASTGRPEKGDESQGIVLSYKDFGQKKLWLEREKLANDNEDPIEVDED